MKWYRFLSRRPSFHRGMRLRPFNSCCPKVIFKL